MITLLFPLLKSNYFNLARLITESIILFFLFYFRFKKYKNTDLILSNKTVEELIEEFIPEEINEIEINSKIFDIPSFPSSTLYELADYDFYNRINSYVDICSNTIKNYGVGTCGPPGFYGTLDLHLELEKKIAENFGTESSILYSNNFTCINSVITCFCKSKDVIFYYCHSNEAILRGISISKATSVYFNGIEDLNKKIKIFYSKKHRNFLIVEGLCRNTGEIINLQEIIEIKKKYKLRLIVDESLSYPLLSSTGSIGYWNVNIKDVDILMGSLSHVIPLNGGFSASSSYVVEYQRLSAPSYCFSASLPGFFASAALQSFNFYAINTSNLFHKYFLSENYSVISHKDSPLVIITHKNNLTNNSLENELLRIYEIKNKLLKHGVRVGVNQNPFPSLRICVKKGLSSKEVMGVINKVKMACETGVSNKAVDNRVLVIVGKKNFNKNVFFLELNYLKIKINDELNLNEEALVFKFWNNCY
ncbi:putative class I/II aminotransferase [Hamiltosporidium magnivora]|uniref:serine C-palmitoyltransferase n=1 Tax=Hamiltosporidium magnivora TaxID=148818 RepID=A0A4Q9LGN8_9MICR|nr:putative class I/II aminotransferase [Hamiltosporidium magnivora]